ncbi:GntR family transcriptional regulator [Methylomonas paludis]|uniref:GntR family transcriptional regulator n=1 Tax=Methylomonas paludis TaxID=1173101 RepID=A0A975MPA8_9GAMM|nr:GntR family transcriptional regulator [Methylomonas paludis]QWF71533.1 GntR family transcriptional regulator [Methylomonas paludis]
MLNQSHLPHHTEYPPKDSSSFIERLRPDPGVSEPVYQQLLNRISWMILSGEIPEGFSLPSERTLAEALNISRTTVRRCYDELRAQDHISTHGRLGVKVKSPPRISPQMGRLKGFTEEMRELGMQPSTLLLERAIVQDRTVSSLFGRPSTAEFLKLVRIRLGDEIPLSRECAWYDLTLAPELANWDVSGSAYAFLQEHCGIILTHADQSIEAVMNNQVEAEAFGFDKPEPCLLLKRKTYSVAGPMVEYVEGTFRGDAYTYRVKLQV